MADGTYDYIVIGAGSAGCVLAARLTDDPNVKVLLLEAGGPDVKRSIHIPAAFTKLFKSPVDWAYETEPQARLNDRKMFWPRGKVLGGSSSINAMIYIRGNGRDYDHWHRLGNTGWSFGDVLPFFKRAEHQERGASQYHGVGGPLNVADRPYTNPLSRRFVEAGPAIGLPCNDDFNGKEQDGVGLYQVTQKRGKRHSAAGAYLKSATARPNLAVHTDARVTRLVLQGSRASEVEYVQGGTTRSARAEREIVLCAGAISSPHLLMLSGIGPANRLEALDIPVAVDLPGVGENLQDHLVLPVAWECRKPISLAGAGNLRNLLIFAALGRGPLTSNLAEAGGFARTTADLEMPDLQFHFVPAYYLNHGFTTPRGHGFTIGPTLIHPKSRGTVRPRSNDPLDPPAIQPNYLADDDDLRVLIAGVRVARKLAQASAFDGTRGLERYPGQSAESDERIAEYVRAMVQTLYHPVGTCKMGNDSMAVVDDRLQVRGVEALRVADASIMPTIVGGNTNAPTIMIAEKCAELIRGGG